VQSIRDAALVLRISENEAQVVERILEALTPTQLACFVYQAPTSTFLQLEKLAVVGRNIKYADHTRKPRSTSVTVSAVECHRKAWNPRFSHAEAPTTSRTGKPVVFSIVGRQDTFRKTASFV
jgi:hypothetical protein